MSAGKLLHIKKDVKPSGLRKGELYLITHCDGRMASFRPKGFRSVELYAIVDGSCEFSNEHVEVL